MPRPNQPRSIASEIALAGRISYEREKRGWSYDGMASRMTSIGCSINSSAIYKIEKTDPPRRITVDELVGFSQVFEIGVEDLLIPPELIARERLRELLVDWEMARRARIRAIDEVEDAEQKLRAHLEANPGEHNDLEKMLGGWIGNYFDEDDQPVALAMWMWKLTDSDERREEIKRLWDERWSENGK